MSFSRRDLFRAAAAAAGVPLWAFDGGPRPEKRGMIVRSARPEDLEMPLAGFEHYVTPVEQFFVRSHHYEPRVDAASWKLTVDGEVARPIALSMAELRKLPKVELVSVLECAGNNRGFYSPTVPGLQWEYGSVGNGRWGGVRLADVLKQAGVKPTGKVVLLDGADVAIGTMPKFQRTITVAKAMDPNTLLAYEMNGSTLPNQHGFPLRLIAPGWASDSWVKWLQHITVLDHEFDGFFMKTAYRHPGRPVKPGAAVSPADMQPVTSLRVKSVVRTPLDGTDVAVGKALVVAGAAWSGDGGPVTSVKVSIDGGRTWNAATLGVERSRFGWVLYNYSFTPRKLQYYTILARARSANDVQPLAQEWNPSGYQWNVVQRVGVNATEHPQAASPMTAAEVSSGAQPSGFRQSCLACHGEDVIRQQKLTPAQWQREVEKMERWGSQVKPGDREGILRYLEKFK